MLIPSVSLKKGNKMCVIKKHQTREDFLAEQVIKDLKQEWQAFKIKMRALELNYENAVKFINHAEVYDAISLSLEDYCLDEKDCELYLSAAHFDISPFETIVAFAVATKKEQDRWSDGQLPLWNYTTDALYDFLAMVKKKIKETEPKYVQSTFSEVLK